MIDAGKISGDGLNGTINSNFFDVNAERKTNEFVETVDKKIKEYNDNADARMNEYNNTADGLMNIATDTRNELERVKNDVLETGEASGSYLTLNDSTMAELQELEVNSVEKQVTTQGYNLWNFKENQTSRVKVNDDGTITINGNGGFSIYIDPITLEAGKTYYETFELVSGSITSSGKLFLSSSPNGNVWMENKIPVSCTMTEDKERTGIWVNDNATFNNATVKFWITEGEKKDWEPYTGGTASPSPDYPQEIPMITTDSVLKSVGKNLFNKTILKDNCFVSVTGGETSSDTSCIWEYIKVKPNTTYILTYQSEDYSFTQRISEYTNDKTFIQRTTASKSNYVFTTGSTTEYINLSGLKEDSNIQIEEGSTATEYEPYQESILNIPIPEGEFVGYINDNAKDTLRVGYNEEDGNYHLYLDKMLRREVFDGSELWTKSVSYSTDDILMFFVNDDNKYKSDMLSINNRFQYGRYNDLRDTTINRNMLGSAGNSINIKIQSNIIGGNTVELFKTWLSTNNVEVVHELRNPYTLDLGIVDMPISYDGVTNIFVDTDLLMNINTKYYRNFTETIRNLQINNDTLKNELTSIESRLTALETAQTSVVSESEVVE